MALRINFIYINEIMTYIYKEIVSRKSISKPFSKNKKIANQILPVELSCERRKRQREHSTAHLAIVYFQDILPLL